MKALKLGFLQKIIIVVLAVILIASIVTAVWLSGMMASQMSSAEQFSQSIHAEKPHVFILVSNIDMSFREAFLVGAHHAAEDNDIDLEVADAANTGSPETYANAMAAAVAARVDGIILQPAWREALTDAVKQAEDKAIPFMTVEEDVTTSGRISNIGFNSFEFGNLIARLAGEASNYQCKIAVVFRGLNQDNGMESNLKIAGLHDIAAHYGGMKIVRIEQGTNAFFGAEETIRDILTQNPEVNTLICMTARDTVAAAQTVLDLNRLKDVQIIGTDLTPEIQILLDKKVLYGTISRNPERIGYQSVEAMARHLSGKAVPDFIDVGLEAMKK